jgi:hypothetical protein
LVALVDRALHVGGHLLPGRVDEVVERSDAEHVGGVGDHVARDHQEVGVGRRRKRLLERSSGAVSNCLARLTDAKKVRQVSAKPRRYSIAA